MNNDRESFSQRFFTKYTEFIIRYRIPVLIIGLIIIFSLIIIFLPKIKQDVSFVSIFGKESKIRKDDRLFKEKYGRDEVTIIGIESDNIFTIPFLQKLKSFHEELENCSDKITEVTSLINARLTEGINDEIVVHDLIEDFPEDENDLSAIKQTVLNNQAYKNILINEKANFTTIVIETDIITDLENIDVVLNIKKVAKKYNSNNFTVYVAGSPAIMQVLDSVLAKDFAKFVGITLLIICIILFIVFRRPSGLILPIIIIILNLLLVLTLKSIFKSPISTVTNALIPFLMAVGIGDAIHILAVFFNEWKSNDTKDALITTVNFCGLPCLFTSLTTCAGLFSFINGRVVTIRDLGIYGGIGVVIAYILTMTLIIIGLSFLKKPKKTKILSDGKKVFFPSLEKKIQMLGNFGIKNHLFILIFVLILSGVCFYFISKVKVAHDPLSWIAKKDPVVIATRKLDSYLNGSVGLELMINTDKENKFTDPTVLHKVEILENKAKNFKKDNKNFISSTISVLTMIREINKAVNSGNDEYYTIPDNQNLIAQELLLFESGGGDKSLYDYVSYDFSDLRITFRAPWIDTSGYKDFLIFIKKEAQELFTGDKDITNENIILCGNMAIFSKAINEMLPLTIRGFIIAFIIVTLFMIVLFRDLKLGLLSMIPNLFPIIFTLAIMGLFKIKLDMFNLFVGSIALGIVVDDTIHMIHHIQENMKRYDGDVEKSVNDALLKSGRAVVFTTVILCLGFSSYLFSSMGNIYSFGILLIITLITALLADIIVTPAVITFFYKKRK